MLHGRDGLKLLALSLILVAYGCQVPASLTPDGNIYTLYRNSVVLPGGQTHRYHVATFDTADGHDYNMENCEQARELFMAQPGVRTRFWCEKGRFRK